ncbi:MAG: sugar ABC transporter permease [Clostridiales bacterium]|nr:sugar ABC transporter permease [Clostridiales bacterium]
MSTVRNASPVARSRAILRRRAALRRYLPLYLLATVPVAYLIVYRYYPIIAQFAMSFSIYKLRGGIWGSPWVGWANFRELFHSSEFARIMTNTINISMLNLVAGFFPPILLAIMLFDVTSVRFNRISQSLLYLPHFFSWVVVYNLVLSLFSNSGFINGMLEALGFARSDFLMQTGTFLPLLVGSALWKELGWGTIIYLAALTSIDTELFDVAKIDGAGPLQRIWYITLPGILPVVVFVLTLSLGRIFSAANTEQILLFYGPHNYSISDVIGTWVYRQGLGKLKFSLGAAVSMFQSIIGLILVLLSNAVAKRTAGVGIW